MSEPTPEFKPGGSVPTEPQYATRESLGRIVVVNTASAQLAAAQVAVDALTQHMTDQNPERLEQDRAAAWGYDTERLSPDAMTVTFDRDDEK